MPSSNNVLGVDLKIDQEYIGKVVEEVVKCSMIEALNLSNGLAEQAINKILSQKVNGSGEFSTSSYDKETWIEHQLKNGITAMAMEELKVVIEERRDEIREIFKKELSKKARLNDFVNCFFLSLDRSLSTSWKSNINIDFEKRGEE